MTDILPIHANQYLNSAYREALKATCTQLLRCNALLLSALLGIIISTYFALQNHISRYPKQLFPSNLNTFFALQNHISRYPKHLFPLQNRIMSSIKKNYKHWRYCLLGSAALSSLLLLCALVFIPKPKMPEDPVTIVVEDQSSDSEEDDRDNRRSRKRKSKRSQPKNSGSAHYPAAVLNKYDVSQIYFISVLQCLFLKIFLDNEIISYSISSVSNFRSEYFKFVLLGLSQKIKYENDAVILISSFYHAPSDRI